jgi:hypothetical protein
MKDWSPRSRCRCSYRTGGTIIVIFSVENVLDRESNSSSSRGSRCFFPLLVNRLVAIIGVSFGMFHFLDLGSLFEDPPMAGLEILPLLATETGERTL